MAADQCGWNGRSVHHARSVTFSRRPVQGSELNHKEPKPHRHGLRSDRPGWSSEKADRFAGNADRCPYRTFATLAAPINLAIKRHAFMAATAEAMRQRPRRPAGWHQHAKQNESLPLSCAERYLRAVRQDAPRRDNRPCASLASRRHRDVRFVGLQYTEMGDCLSLGVNGTWPSRPVFVMWVASRKGPGKGGRTNDRSTYHPNLTPRVVRYAPSCPGENSDCYICARG